MWRSKFSVPSRLDSYKQFLTGLLYSFGENPPEYTDEIFVRQLLKLEPASAKMEAGTIMHRVFELAEYGNLSRVSLNGWTMICPDSVNFEVELPECREIPIKAIVGDKPIFGKVDSISATTVRDLKFTGKFDAERYMQSMQWKTYLTMTRFDNFIYDVIVTDTDEINKVITIKSYEKLTLYRYDNLDEEVKECINNYWELLNHLKPLIFEIAAANNIEIKERQ
jgi:hypothetical protein